MLYSPRVMDTYMDTWLGAKLNHYRESLLKANRNSCESLSGLEREAVELLEPVEYKGYVGMADRLVG